MIVRLQTCCVEKDMRSASSGTESSCSGKLSISVMCPGHRHERILYDGVTGCRGSRTGNGQASKKPGGGGGLGGEKGWGWGWVGQWRTLILFQLSVSMIALSFVTDM